MSESPENPEREGEGAAEADLVRNRLNNLERIRKLVDVYPFAYQLTDSVSDIAQRYGETTSEELDRLGIVVKTAGRVLAQRRQGKAGFLDISDGSARLQIYARKDSVGEEGWSLYDALDLGDWIGVEGQVFRTRTG